MAPLHTLGRTRNRDVTPGHAPGNGNQTSWAARGYDNDTVAALQLPPTNGIDTGTWLEANDLSLPGPAFGRMEEILNEKRVVTARDRFDAFETAYEEYYGYSHHTNTVARAGLAALEQAGLTEEVAALKAILNTRVAPGRAFTQTPTAEAEDIAAAEETAEPQPVNTWDKHFFVSDTGIFYDVNSDEAPQRATRALAWADGNLKPEDQERLASLLAYAIAAVTHDRRSLEPYVEEGTVGVSQESNDFMPSNQQAKIADLMEEYVVYGTPLRSTDRSGTGTAGTRAIDGFGLAAPAVRVLFGVDHY